ncbi:MAG: DNA polymerase/3'-5' exonuclease PolX [Anaerosomatales bacterium]|nr:DNA polymerase/3'-5' exonuclease PolX [Anaerosomatales bacterium]MDT8434850.1 DNA polymerase/3'-5' exonuclease PolX [Anaerosomatales bacterium]
MPELDNAAIARELEVMGDLLEIAGADRFRVLSYRKAANSIRAWPEQLSAMAEQDRLTEVPGVGKRLAASITEMLHHGTFPELEAAKAEYPAGLVELTQVAGVGPTRARQFYDKLGVDSVDALLHAIDSGELGRIGGMGEKTVASIRRGVESFLAHRGRMLLRDALPLAERLAAELLEHPAVLSATPAGSLRRMQETVGDIDIITASEDGPAVMDAVRELPAVARVLGSGETKTSVLTTSGLQVDVRVVAPEQAGAALQYFTGSKEHNIALRQIAKRAGMKVNEYGVFRVDAQGTEVERLGGTTEDEVYELLGFPQTPPPEIRHDTGEIEAALAGTLPRLVEPGDIRGDFHAHTTSTDAHSTLEENRAMAAELGYEYLVVTDHAENLRMVRGMTVPQLEEQWAEVDALNAARGELPYILKGVELNIGADGTVDYAPDVLARFDFCIASLHSGWGEDGEAVTGRLLRAMESLYVDIIGHPTGRIIGRRDPIALDMDSVLARAAETGTIMELNAYPDRLDLSDAHLRLAMQHGVRIAIGTDAHRAEHMRYMRYGVATARRGWVTPDLCLNAQPLDTVRSWLRRNSA